MLGKRLKQFRTKLNLSVEQIAHSIDVNPRTYGGYERGEREPSFVFYQNLSKKYSLNIDWLITGEGDIFSKRVIDDNCCELKIRGEVNASLGHGVTVYDESQTGSYSISKQLAKDIGINPKTSEIIFAKGDSMEPTIIGGDSLLIDLSKKDIYDGKIYCVRIDGQLYAKRLQKIPPKIVNVISDNPKYKSFEINFSKLIDFDFEVMGEIRWWGRIAR